MKMLGYGVITSSNILLVDSYQDLIEIDSDFMLTGTIIDIPRKHANYWTIQWDNNLLKTKTQTKSLWSQVMKCDNKWQNIYLMQEEGLIHCTLKVNINSNWIGTWHIYVALSPTVLLKSRCQHLHIIVKIAIKNNCSTCWYYLQSVPNLHCQVF